MNKILEKQALDIQDEINETEPKITQLTIARDEHYRKANVILSGMKKCVEDNKAALKALRKMLDA